MRETMLLWAVVLIAVAVVRAWRTREWRVPIVYAALTGVFLGAFLLHLSLAKDFIKSGAAATPFFQYITAIARSGLEHNFLQPTSYLGLPYGLFAFPLFPLLLTGIAGFVLVLADRPWARWAAAGYLAAEGLYYLTLGATSSYWGQHVMPLALIGTAALLAYADRALLPRETTGQPPSKRTATA
jgi:hypothetical protein